MIYLRLDLTRFFKYNICQQPIQSSEKENENMKKTLALILAVLFTAAVFAGCSGSNDSGAEPAATAGESPAVSTEPSDSDRPDDGITGTYYSNDYNMPCTLVLEEDGTGSWTVDGDYSEITWTQQGSKLVITAAENNHEFIINADGSFTHVIRSMVYRKK